jgi:LuxR family maltose regulon positive regulatory protein
MVTTEDSSDEFDLAAALLDALAQAPGESYLMIDDFHHVGDPATVGLVQAMADAMLPGLHLVIASRTRPALRLGRLLAMEDVVAVDGAELLFNLDETEAFLKARPDVRLGPESACKSMTSRTAGRSVCAWPVGLCAASFRMARPRAVCLRQ